MGVEQIMDSAVRRYVMSKKAFDTRRREKEACRRHPDWNGLTAYEARLAGKDAAAYTIFKNLNGGDIRSFVPEAVFQNRVLYRLNPSNYGPDGRYRAGEDYFADKNFQHMFLPRIAVPACVFRKIGGIYYTDGFEVLTPCEAYKLAAGYEELVFKQSTETGHGRGICPCRREQYGKAMDVDGDFIVQERIIQHESMAKFNKSSVNVVRITTVLWRGHVYVLGGILRVGAPGSFCDHKGYDGKPPLVVGLDESGWLSEHAVDCDNHELYGTLNGTAISGRILRYHEMKAAAVAGHRRLPKHGIIGWDFALDYEERVVCIEYNERFPGITQTQYALGAVFSQRTVDGRTLYGEIVKGEDGMNETNHG